MVRAKIFVCAAIVLCALQNFSTPAGVDASVGCAENPPKADDVAATWDGKTLSISANPKGKEGMFVNAIVEQKLEYVSGVYTVSGKFRIPEDAQNEHISINVQWFENNTEYYSELFYTTNPYSPLYEWVWTRNKLDEQIKLFKIEHDGDWHTFTIISDHIKHVTKKIQVDNLYSNVDLQMGSVSRKHKDALIILYENHNQFPGCGSTVVTKGASEWRNIRITNEKNN